MKKVETIVYIVVVVLLIGLIGAFVIRYKDNVAETLDIDTGIEFTADKVADKAEKKLFSEVNGGKQIFTCKKFALWANSFANVYQVTFNNDGTKSTHSLPAKDETTFTHLIVLTGSTPVWNLTNRTDEVKTFTLYYTITDGRGLVQANDLYYAKGGSLSVTESDLCIFDIDGKEIKVSGEVNNKPYELGQPYMVTFALNAGQSCVLRSTLNRLVIYGIDCD